MTTLGSSEESKYVTTPSGQFLSSRKYLTSTYGGRIADASDSFWFTINSVKLLNE